MIEEDEKPEDKLGLHNTDKELINAAKTGEGLIKLTPELMDNIAEGLKEREEYINERYPKLVEECPDETRLAIVAWVFKNIVDHAQDGGSFRDLIYERLGFGPDAYLPLYAAGGMAISNEFDLTEEDNV